MRLYKNKWFWVTGTFAFLAFLLLFMIRLDLFEKFFNRPQSLEIYSISSPHEKETWMNIFQNNRKIGFSHTKISPDSEGYRLQETVLMRINTMGLVQDIQLKTRGRLKADYSLSAFDFEINSGRFSFSVNGTLSGEVLTVTSASAGSRRRMDIRLKNKPYLMAGITSALAAVALKAGDKYAFDIFDPATLGTKVALDFKGTTQVAWIDASGDVLQEKGILGIRLEKTTREIALEDLAVESSADLTKIASVASNVMLANPAQLERLKFEISGIQNTRVRLNGGRQIFRNNVLTIDKESLANLAHDLDGKNLGAFEKIYLQPTAFIQSDHQNIQTLAQKIVAGQMTPLDKVQALVDWVYQNIDKRPVLSLPDALSTLENRVGDCNEHAVLFAALARATGIPCRLEAGLVYLKGRFYYHAWNLVYLGRWVTVDALFGQVPADVSHIRLVTGSPRQQLDLMGFIGKINLKVIE
ncbi:MAG: transglutaminase domain-containing protein [Deltaproteobacteria bacterium]|nr:transglutaminase domain-containing protein [Deltaproteobacteria bacterium]